MFSKEIPTKPGYYWYKSDVVPEKIVMKLEHSEDASEHCDPGDLIVYIQDGDEWEYLGIADEIIFESDNGEFKFIEDLEHDHVD